MSNKAWGWLLMAAVFALDQASKAWLITDAPRVWKITPFFNVVMVWNHGISFGMLASHDARWLLIGVSLVAAAALLAWLQRGVTRPTACGIGLVTGGALGNALDRLRLGAVADFFDLHAAGWHWPAFNVADSAICMGVALLCATSMLHKDYKAST
ncbi:MAG: signal peptidase II [Alphaproteobacteria bacterium]|nr:signal peptidase II [Alphaproteobacteria bacterium]